MPKNVDAAGIVGLVPRLDTLHAVGKDGWTAGRAVEVDKTGEWHTRLARPLHSIDRLPKTDLILDTELGLLTLRNAVITHASSDGDLRGKCTEFQIVPLEAVGLNYSKCILIIEAEPDLLNWITFPDRIRDLQSGRMSVSLLPLKIHGIPVDVYYLPEAAKFVLEHDSFGSEENLHVQSAVRRLLTYLTGKSFASASCRVDFDENGNVGAWTFWPGKNLTCGFYRPIPVAWGEWWDAHEKLGL